MEEPGERTNPAYPRQHRRGLAVELTVGIVLSVILALMVALAGGAMTSQPDRPVITTFSPVIDDEAEDLNPRDPLVMCTVFMDYTTCAREPS